MKRPYLFALSAACLISNALHAQAPFSTVDHVDINNIKAAVLVHGDMFWDPSAEVADCKFPATAPTSINFASALWMSGYDAGNQLHVAAQTYRQDGNDYWPGPLDTADAISYATSSNWAKIWKVNRTDITTFLGLSTHTTSNTPAMILTWPGKGNVNAQGNGGAALTVTNNMAPFVDLNHNGIYEPLLGEYPDIPGDQALWWVFGDNGPAHTESKGRPLGVEVHAMAYAYKNGTSMDNVIYYDYKITNRSTNNYTNFRMGLFDDVDLGYSMDDFIGFDSSHRMGIAYNGTSDDGGSAGHPANSYGTTPPMVGVSMVVLPGDDVSTLTHVPAGSFVYYNNDFSLHGNPKADTEYDHYLRSSFRDGTHITNDFAGAGTPSIGYGTGPLASYVYTGDPAINTQWSECASGNTPGDRRFVITSNDFTMTAGSTQEVVMALIAMPEGTDNACPAVGFTAIEKMADTVWNTYFSSLSVKTAVNNVIVNNGVNIYPNPAHDRLFIDDVAGQNSDASVMVYNMLGQYMNVPTDRINNKTTVNISSLPSGMYHLVYRNGDRQTNAKFVKE